MVRPGVLQKRHGCSSHSGLAVFLYNTTVLAWPCVWVVKPSQSPLSRHLHSSSMRLCKFLTNSGWDGINDWWEKRWERILVYPREGKFYLGVRRKGTAAAYDCWLSGMFYKKYTGHLWNNLTRHRFRTLTISTLQLFHNRWYILTRQCLLMTYRCCLIKEVWDCETNNLIGAVLRLLITYRKWPQQWNQVRSDFMLITSSCTAFFLTHGTTLADMVCCFIWLLAATCNYYIFSKLPSTRFYLKRSPGQWSVYCSL